jgi:hypothetical protein
MDVVKGDLKMYVLTPGIHCDQMAIGLSPFTSAVFLFGK